MTQPLSNTPSRTAAATRARMRAREERMAAELVARGWTCTPPNADGTPAAATSSPPVDLVAIVRPLTDGARVTVVGPPCRGSTPRANLDQLGEHMRAAFMVPGESVPRRADSAHQVGPFAELLAAQGYALTGPWVVGADRDGRPRATVTVREVRRGS